MKKKSYLFYDIILNINFLNYFSYGNVTYTKVG
jgi:hypothetical protein